MTGLQCDTFQLKSTLLFLAFSDSHPSFLGEKWDETQAVS